MIFGITGGTGCGKTTALAAIEALGGIVIDCDRVYHRLLETDREMLRAIDARFPGTVIEGALNRKALGGIVFADPQALLDLNAITHAAVKAEVLRLLDPAPALAAIDAIGLFEGGLAPLCDVTVAVTAPEECRIARLMARDGITREYAESRIAAQRPQEEFKALCDHALENDGTKEAFFAKCLAFFKSLAIIRETEKGECI